MKQNLSLLSLLIILFQYSTFGQHIQAEREMLRRLDKLLITTQECRDGKGNFNIIENRLDIWNGHLYLLERTSKWSGKSILPNEWDGYKIPLNSLSRIRLFEEIDGGNCFNRLNSQTINAGMEIFHDKPGIGVIIKFDNIGNPIEKIGGSYDGQSIRFNIDLYSSIDIPIEQEKKNFLNWFKIFKSN